MMKARTTGGADGRGDALARMRLAAGLILVALVAVYLVSFFLPWQGSWVHLMRASAAAGVVGGLADWFAVVALFRHPLGLPIPHTALLPRNQQRVARNVGSFIEEHFLIPDEIARSIRGSRISEVVAGWVLSGQNRSLLAGHVAAALTRMSGWPLPEALQDALMRVARQSALSAGDSRMLAREVATILKLGAAGEGLTHVIGYLREAIDDNRDMAQHLIQQRSRWWVNPRLDRRVANLGVNGVLSTLDELADGGSDLRRKFDAAVQEGIERLHAQGVLQDMIRQAIGDYADSADFSHAAEGLAQATRARITAQLATPDMQAAIEGALAEAAQALLSDPRMREGADAALAVMAAEIVAATRSFFGRYVAETISAWPPDQLVARFEAEAGKDLQFIRINGSLLGCVIGGALYVIERALA